MRNAFSDSYAEARAKFLDAAHAAGARLAHYRHPDARGPRGEELHFDVALLGPHDAPRRLVIGCGTHGIEGYSGSAVQTNWMLRQGPHRMPRDTALVFFHAHNPWGFAWKTRMTEDNVDLNRNFVDFSRPLPANPGYEEVHRVITPATWDEPTVAGIFGWLDSFRQRVGEKAFSDAFNGGQYAHPDGIFFGGQRAQWANGAFRQAVREHLAGARQVAFIDLHTGIGPRYEHIYLCFHPQGSPAYERARAWWGERAVNRQGVTHKALATYQGVIIDAFAEMLPGVELTPIVIEFGTLPREGMQRASLAQRWLRFHGSKQPGLAATVQRDYEEAFYPSDARWRAAALEQSIEFIERGIAGIAGS